ncbi:MAG: anthranilate synthase component I family protein [Thermodesulfovibrionales bacterium]|nr:anthranilate synthase component I family protein [Thermodesulfovibrionales bacterium]
MTGITPQMPISKQKFLDSVRGEGLVPVLYAEMPYSRPGLLYPEFSGPGSFLFESVKGPAKIASYSFIGFDPYIIFTAKDGFVELKSGGKRSLSARNPLRRLKGLLDAYKQKPSPELPPFQGGAAGLLCYDFVRYFEDIPAASADTLKIPDAHFFLIDRLIAFDHIREKSWAVVCPGLRDMGLGYEDPSNIDWNEKYREAEDVLNEILRRAAVPGNALPTWNTESRGGIEVIHEMSGERYKDMVKRAKEYIAAGDIFQANLSLRVSAYIGDTKPWSLYSTLSAINPSPFACFMDFGDYSIVSSSPERLLMVRDKTVETRPIAGTRPRGRDETEDEAMRSELLLNEKERAEHIMLIDLERNDIGRVSDYGSVVVDELMITEDYSHVIHIVSNIRGRLAPGNGPFDCIRAVFPGGTITGVPKVRCMEIIDELEPVRRGPYTGSAGYIGFSGSADFNIIIRTFIIKDRTAYVQAGAGIVADSDPEREYSEAIKKAEALINTLKKHKING